MNPNTRKSFFLFAVLSVFVVFLLLGVFILRSGTKFREETKDLGKIPSIAPWVHAETAELSPPGPGIDELDAKYREVRKAIDTRDYELFTSIASSERVWHVENPKKLVSEVSTGEAVFELLEPRGSDNFIKYAPYAISYNMPRYADITPRKVVKRFPSTRNDIIVVDPRTREQTRVKMHVWKETIDLEYDLKESSLDTGFGKVSFVWDKDSWRYNGEDWQIDPHDKPVNLGLGESPDITVNFEFGSCNPDTAKISEGQVVMWRGINGIVYSTSGDYWSSNYLYGDNFIKRFDKKGEYTYLIMSPEFQPENGRECKLVVE